MSKHTPGQWTVEQRAYEMNYWSYVPIHADTEEIALVTWRKDWEKNARLIAAAPELLASLQEVVASSRDCEVCTGSGLEPRTESDACPACGGTGEYAVIATVADIRAAIAKATEEQTNG